MKLVKIELINDYYIEVDEQPYFFSRDASADYAFKMAIQALSEIQQYRAIGTVEDFKALKEKNEPKKIAYQGEHQKCPTCGSFHVFGKHCTECGQKIDLEKEKNNE